MRVFSSLILSATALVSLPSFAGTLTASQILSQFNAIVTNDLSTNHDIEGRLVTGYLDTSRSATLYKTPNGSTSDYAAVNAVAIGSGTSMNVNNAGNVNYVNSNAGSFSFNGGHLVKQSPDFNLTDFTQPLNALQTQLSKLATNSYVNSTDPNAFTFVETGTTAVFSLTTTDLEKAASRIEFSGSASTIIINVYGTSFIENSGANLQYDKTLAGKIIWNFVDATSISVKNWGGSVLAGDATVTNGSPIDGVLYAQNFNGNGELHNVAFTGTLPAVPEPETYAMLLAGLGLMGCVARRKKSV